MPRLIRFARIFPPTTSSPLQTTITTKIASLPITTLPKLQTPSLPTNALRLTTLLSPLRTSSLSSSLSKITSLFSNPTQPLQIRTKVLGNFYQPSTLKRKRKHGFLARMRSVGGKKILQRRRLKGRWHLTY